MLRQLRTLALCLVIALILASAATAQIYMIQGPDGPEVGKRPSPESLAALKQADHGERMRLAAALAEAGFTLDVPHDVWRWPYWKLMAARRQYGYAWVPAAHQPNILIAPGLSRPDLPKYDPDNPPLGAILVPASEEEDPNYVEPEVVPPPPPTGKAVFGPPANSPDFPGAFLVGATNTAPVGSHATRNEVEYVYHILPRGFTGGLRLWLPVAPE